MSNELAQWKGVRLERHPSRRYRLGDEQRLVAEWRERPGGRALGDDQAQIGGLARLDGEPVMIIGQQKGRSTKENIVRSFGMPRPEGYRKALRLMKLAERFDRPVIAFIDTPGAYPGIDAEERGQAEAIAVCLEEMAGLQVPVCRADPILGAKVNVLGTLAVFRGLAYGLSGAHAVDDFPASLGNVSFGAGVTEYAQGDAVFGMFTKSGTFAEFATVSARDLRLARTNGKLAANEALSDGPAAARPDRTRTAMGGVASPEILKRGRQPGLPRWLTDQADAPTNLQRLFLKDALWPRTKALKSRFFGVAISKRGKPQRRRTTAFTASSKS